MNDEIFFPICGLGFFFLVFAFFGLLRYLNYRETLALAEKGLVRGRLHGNGGKDTLRWGIAITAVGLALCAGLYPLGFVINTGFPLGFGPWMLGGLLPTFFGLGLILIYVVTREDNKHKDEPPAIPPAAPPTDRDA